MKRLNAERKMVSFIKRVGLLLLMLAVIYPMTANAFQPRSMPIESMMGTTISLPFLTTDAPVGISSADIRLSWEERETLWPCREYFTSYRGMLHADYTIHFTGNEPATIAVALPLTPHRDFPTVLLQDLHVYLDGSPIEVSAYFVPENIQNAETYNLAGRKTPSLAQFIYEVRLHSSEQPRFMPTTFDADEPAVLYTIVVEGVRDLRFNDRYIIDTTILLRHVEVSLSFDQEQTTVMMFSHRGSTALRDSIYFDRLKRNTIAAARVFGLNVREEILEVLVIGKDTLTWDAMPIFYEDDFMQDYFDLRREFIDRMYLHVSSSKVVPREYLRNIQNEHLLPADASTENIMVDSDILLMGIDTDIRWHSPGVSQVHNRVRSRFLDVVIPDEPNLFIVEIPFEPGQKRTLSVSFPIYSGSEWDSRGQQSLFHHTILIEAAAYWSFFDALTVTVYHPGNVIDSKFSDGFVVCENKTVLSTNIIDDNIHIGFVMSDERSTGGGSGWGLVIIFIGVGIVMLGRFLLPYIIAAVIIGVIVLIVIKIKRRRAYLKNNPPDFKNSQENDDYWGEG